MWNPRMKAALDSNFLRKDRDLAQRSNGPSKGPLPPARLFEKPPLKCYKSDLHHALNFAYSEQKRGFLGWLRSPESSAGKGFPARGLVAFPTRSHPRSDLTFASTDACVPVRWRECRFSATIPLVARHKCAGFGIQRASELRPAVHTRQRFGGSPKCEPG